MPKYFLGVDYHKNHSFCSLMDAYGNTVETRKIKNDLSSLKHFLYSYQNDEIEAVLEAGRNWTLMYGWLEECVKVVKLAHPYKVKIIAEAKIKTDKIDSLALAHLLRTNLMPEAHVPTKSTWQARQILRQRAFYVRLSTMTKNRIRTIVDRHPELGNSPCKGLFTNQSLIWLKNSSLKFKDNKERQVLLQDLNLLENLELQISQSNKMIKDLVQSSPQCQLLRTIPGLGDFFSALVFFEIDTINRFSDSKKLHAYAGLVPSTYSSGNRTFHGKITKQGNKWLRWAMIEAVWPAISKDKELRFFYERLKKRKGPNPAKVATARRLLTICFKVLKENRPYQYHQVPSFFPGCSQKRQK